MTDNFIWLIVIFSQHQNGNTADFVYVYYRGNSNIRHLQVVQFFPDPEPKLTNGYIARNVPNWKE